MRFEDGTEYVNPIGEIKFIRSGEIFTDHLTGCFGVLGYFRADGCFLAMGHHTPEGYLHHLKKWADFRNSHHETQKYGFAKFVIAKSVKWRNGRKIRSRAAGVFPNEVTQNPEINTELGCDVRYINYLDDPPELAAWKYSQRTKKLLQGLAKMFPGAVFRIANYKPASIFGASLYDLSWETNINRGPLQDRF
jgi:hypothetical protein